MGEDSSMKGPMTTAGITVGELRERLLVYQQDAQLFFGGLRFYRLKRRGDKLVQLEFAEAVYRTKRGKLIAEDAP